MKPMGLDRPAHRTASWAVVQLRQENLRAESFNLVGFQNHMKFGEQARVLRLIPGLENAEFLRFGQIHRNTYINAPALLTATLQLRTQPRRFLRRPDLRGRRLRGIHRHGPDGRHARGRAGAGETPRAFPRATALGSLCHYISGADPRDYQPANITFDLLPQLDEATSQRLRRDKKARHALKSASARWKRFDGSTWMPIDMPESELERQIVLYLEDLSRARATPPTRSAPMKRPAAVSGVPFAARPRAARPPAIDLLLLREWLASLYTRRTRRRHHCAANSAAVRGLFRFMLREGVVPLNVARLVRTPKAPQKLPEVMTAEQANPAGWRGRG